VKTSIAVEVEVDIARPPEDVWAFVSDAERLPEWLEEFHTVVKESPGPPGRGSVFRYTLEPGDRTSTLRYVEWEPGRRLAWDGPPLRSRGGGARPRGSFEVAAAGGSQTRFVSRYQPELSGTLALLAPLIRRWLRKQRPVDNRRLKALLEGRRSPPGP